MKKILLLIALVAASMTFGACSSTSKCPFNKTKAAKPETCADACCKS